MQMQLLYDEKTLPARIPDDAVVIKSDYPAPQQSAAQTVRAALNAPVQSPGLAAALSSRRPGDVVIVVSDISRPIPYGKFLDELLGDIETAGVPPEDILILIATGMHRPSTPDEHVQILGNEIAARYQVRDHRPDLDDVIPVNGKSWSGADIVLNKAFVNAGFRIITGLVEPHFMAGFSGGRKAVCPGLASLETVQQFHGYEFLANPNARIASLDENPCHLEALSVAQSIGVDFSLNVVLDHDRNIVHATAGELDAAHRQACDFVQACACPTVQEPFDVIVTCSAGAPLDTTFYQCIKGVVNCLPAVKPGGHIISIGGCREGVGSNSYRDTMLKYADDWRQFLADIENASHVIKDQWQFQMHTRTLEKIGREHIHFITDALSQETLNRLSVNGIATNDVEKTLQMTIDQICRSGRRVCVIPEGPYCSPISPEDAA